MPRFYVNMPYAQATKRWYGHFHSVITADSEENALEKALPPLKKEFPNIAKKLPETSIDEKIILSEYEEAYKKLGSQRFYKEVLKNTELSRIQNQLPPKPVPGKIARFLSYFIDFNA